MTKNPLLLTLLELLLRFWERNLEDLIIVFCKVHFHISLDQVRKVVKVFPVVIGKHNCSHTSSLGSNHLAKTILKDWEQLKEQQDSGSSLKKTNQKYQTFSLMPPTGKTLPLRLSSPVMARSANYARCHQCVLIMDLDVCVLRGFTRQNWGVCGEREECSDNSDTSTWAILKKSNQILAQHTSVFFKLSPLKVLTASL